MTKSRAAAHFLFLVATYFWSPTAAFRSTRQLVYPPQQRKRSTRLSAVTIDDSFRQEAKHVLGDTTTTLADLPDWYTASDMLEDRALKSFPTTTASPPPLPRLSPAEVPPTVSTEPLADTASKKVPTFFGYVRDQTGLGQVGEKAKSALGDAGEKAKGTLQDVGEKATKAAAARASSFRMPSIEFPKIDKSSFYLPSIEKPNAGLDFSKLEMPLYKFEKPGFEFKVDPVQLKHLDINAKFPRISSENLSAMKASFTIPTDKFSAVAANVKALVQTRGWTVKDFVGVMNLEELGGWYIGAFGAFLIMVALGQQPVLVRQQNKADFEGQVMQLKDAVTTLAEELQEVKEEKASADKQLKEMKTEVKAMEENLKESAGVEAELRAHVKDLEGERDMLTEQIRKLGSEKPAVRKEQDLRMREVFYANTTSAAAEAATASDIPAPPVPKRTPAKKAKKNAAKKAKKKGKVVAKKTEPAKAKAPKKAPAKAKTKAKVATSSEGDWSKLSMSTLKRKTVMDLTTYLEAKGTPVTDPDGKTLKKAELVQLVLSLPV